MSRSEFFAAVELEFGFPQGRSLLRGLVVNSLGDITPLEALDLGVSPVTVWQALCRSMEVPEHRWRRSAAADLKSDTPG